MANFRQLHDVELEDDNRTVIHLPLGGCQYTGLTFSFQKSLKV